MRQRVLVLVALAVSLLWPAPALAGRPAVCLPAFTDARPVKSPDSVPYNVKAENTPKPLRAHPREGPAEVRRMVLRALKAERGIEVIDLGEADLQHLADDPNFNRCTIVVGGAVFHYEGTVAVDIYGTKHFTGLVGFELVLADPSRGQLTFPPVAFAGRRQSEPVKADDDFGTNDRQTFKEWVGEALKTASASLPARFVRPAVAAARRGAPPPQ
ncbi:MAG: hypothetical protein IH975_11910 [Nitrospinae bacterium]|nr:hypothetical protein [Nitrospinota bacterium]